MPVNNRKQSAQVLSVHGRLFLIDAGEGVQGQMLRYKVPLMKLDSIFISHIHGDHVFGIFGLLSTLGMMARTAPLSIYAPVSFGPVLKFFLSYYGDGLNFEIKFVPLKMKEPEMLFDTKSMEVYAFPLNHKIETFGFLFKEKMPQRNIYKHSICKYEFTLTEIGTLKRGEDVIRGEKVIPVGEVTYFPYIPRSFAYCSDTAPFPELAQWVKGVDLLYHEATYLASQADLAESRHHSTTLQAAQCALDAGAGRLVIGHYSSRVKDTSPYLEECRTVFPQTFAANDGDEFEIPLVKNE